MKSILLYTRSTAQTLILLAFLGMLWSKVENTIKSLQESSIQKIEQATSTTMMDEV